VQVDAVLPFPIGGSANIRPASQPIWDEDGGKLRPSRIPVIVWKSHLGVVPGWVGFDWRNKDGPAGCLAENGLSGRNLPLFRVQDDTQFSHSSNPRTGYSRSSMVASVLTLHLKAFLLTTLPSASSIQTTPTGPYGRRARIPILEENYIPPL
jgi:hypothetical protein